MPLENASGSDEMVRSALVAAGAYTGIDEAALAVVGAVAVPFCLGACSGCLIKMAVDYAGSAGVDALRQILAPISIPDRLTNGLAQNDVSLGDTSSVA